MRAIYLASACAVALLSAPAMAQDQTGADASDNSSFGLGQIIVTGRPPKADAIDIGAATLGQATMEKFQANTLDQAANLIPGVSSGNSGGSRNERLLFVRGFDRFQVPLSIDGIRVYLPADNRLDYGRFLTPDIAEIQVAKGYASVLDGPGAMGGAVNLVTRKPTKALEAEVRGVLNLGREAEYTGYTIFGLIGTRQDKWYAQASFSRNFTDHWDLPGGYTPSASEDGGHRDLSRSRDWRVNVKIGFTPNATDEYSISYTRQEGAKNAPLHVTDPIATPLPTGAPTPRFWTWPWWNIESIYFLSTTVLGDAATLKTRVYRNRFDNLLSSFDSIAQNAQTMPRAFNSYYEDTAWGGSAQLDVNLTDADRFSIAGHYRRDTHAERQDGFVNPAPAVPYSEPWQQNIENTWSMAAENRFAFSPALSLTLGVSYDWRDTKIAQEVTNSRVGSTVVLTAFNYPIANASAFNWQGRLDWQADEDTNIHASVSRRARFPTNFERFSTQFGNAASNPGLRPERAINAEIGGSHRFGGLQADGAIFYSDVQDAIASVRPINFPVNVFQRQNLGHGKYYGAELSLTYRPLPSLQLGANYTFTHRDFDISASAAVLVPVFALTDVPEHKAFVYATWNPVEPITIVPDVEIASGRTTLDTYVPTAPGTVRYYDTGSYVVANLRIDYSVTDRVTVGVGAKNLFDRYYILTDGFPEQGRSFFATLRARY